MGSGMKAATPTAAPTAAPTATDVDVAKKKKRTSNKTGYSGTILTGSSESGNQVNKGKKTILG